MYFYTSIERLGNDIFCIGYKNGKKFQEKIPFKPTLYLKSKSNNSKFKDINGVPLEPIEFDNISEASEFIHKYSNISNFKYYGMETWLYQFTSKEFPGKIEFDYSQIKVCYIDIETRFDPGKFPSPDLASHEITAITIKADDIFHVFGTKEYNNKNDDTVFHYCSDEKHMLLEFVCFMENNKFDIISGWNIEGFDIPYIINRGKKIIGYEEICRISPWKLIKKKTIPTFNEKEIVSYDIYGLNVLDYLLLYRKFSGESLESYRLDFVAEEELKENKIDWHSLGYKDLNDLYDRNVDLFYDYNRKDVDILPKIEKKKNILKLVIMLAYLNKVAYLDVFKQTRMWDSFIYDYLKNKNIIIPKKQDNHKKEQFLGAYVKQPEPGFYEWIVTLDVSSLYPSLFMGYNVGPDTYVNNLNKGMDTVDFMLNVLENGNIHKDYIIKNNLSMASNGTCYRKDKKSFAVEILQERFDQRSKYKKLMLEKEKELESKKQNISEIEKNNLESLISTYKITQNVMKISANSFYGVWGAFGFRFFNLEQAEAITASGQHAIRYAEKRLNEYLSKMINKPNSDLVIFSDTDSLGVTMKPILEYLKVDLNDKELCFKLVKKIVQDKIQPYLDKIFRELYENMNAYDHKISMKLEKICDTGIWTGGKKRYVLNVIENEGVRYDKPKIKVTGAEAVRSNIPKICRTSLQEVYSIILRSTEKDARNYIEEFKEKFYKSDISLIANPSGVNGIEDYSDKNEIYKKGTPFHVKGSILYNKLVKEKGISGKYNYIGDGSKIKYLYLKMPNPLHENVIAFTDNLPEEFDLHRFVDIDKQLQKNFIGPLEPFFEARGWTMEDKISLEDFF